MKSRNVERYAVSMALGLALGCAAEGTKVDTQLSQASAAIDALTARDDTTVGLCAAAAARCSAELPDAAGSTACIRLTEQCEKLGERLAEVRGPAVGCWRGIEACEANAPADAECPDPLQCEVLENEGEATRDPVVACAGRVEACLARAVEAPESAVACDAIAASCERIGAAEGDESEADVERADTGVSASAEGRARAAAARAAGGEDEDEAEDEDEDEDEAEVDGAG